MVTRKPLCISRRQFCRNLSLDCWPSLKELVAICSVSLLSVASFSSKIPLSSRTSPSSIRTRSSNDSVYPVGNVLRLILSLILHSKPTLAHGEQGLRPSPRILLLLQWSQTCAILDTGLTHSTPNLTQFGQGLEMRTQGKPLSLQDKQPEMLIIFMDIMPGMTYGVRQLGQTLRMVIQEEVEEAMNMINEESKYGVWRWRDRWAGRTATLNTATTYAL